MPVLPRALVASLASVLLAAMAYNAAPVATPAVTLEDCMKGIKTGLQTLSRNVSDPANDETSLATVTDMQTWTLAAKSLAPPELDEISDADRDRHAAAFRAEMARLLAELAALEIDVLEGRHEKAYGRIRGSLFELRDSGHSRFQPRDH